MVDPAPMPAHLFSAWANPSVGRRVLSSPDSHPASGTLSRRQSTDAAIGEPGASCLRIASDSGAQQLSLLGGVGTAAWDLTGMGTKAGCNRYVSLCRQPHYSSGRRCATEPGHQNLPGDSCRPASVWYKPGPFLDSVPLASGPLDPSRIPAELHRRGGSERENGLRSRLRLGPRLSLSSICCRTGGIESYVGSVGLHHRASRVLLMQPGRGSYEQMYRRISKHDSYFKAHRVFNHEFRHLASAGSHPATIPHLHPTTMAPQHRGRVPGTWRLL